MSWLTLFNSLVQLILKLLHIKEQKEKEQTEQSIKENPRAFFNKGNLPDSTSSSDDRVQPPTTKE